MQVWKYNHYAQVQEILTRYLYRRSNPVIKCKCNVFFLYYYKEINAVGLIRKVNQEKVQTHHFYWLLYLENQSENYQFIHTQIHFLLLRFLNDALRDV